MLSKNKNRFLILITVVMAIVFSWIVVIFSIYFSRPECDSCHTKNSVFYGLFLLDDQHGLPSGKASVEVFHAGPIGSVLHTNKDEPSLFNWFCSTCKRFPGGNFDSPSIIAPIKIFPRENFDTQLSTVEPINIFPGSKRKRSSALRNADFSQTLVWYDCNQSGAKVKDYYLKELESKGWEIIAVESHSKGNSGVPDNGYNWGILASKGKTKVSIAISGRNQKCKHRVMWTVKL